MKRDIFQHLIAWKESPRRKPLLVRGARQVGKTYILKEFGRNQYDQVHYFNFEKSADLGGFFRRDLNPNRIVAELSIYGKRDIRPASDLIIFDEIQASPAALSSLKYFQEEAGQYHVAGAGSLLGIALSGSRSFPVGKVDFLDLHPMGFAEFLEAVGESRYRQLLEQKQDLAPLAEAFHQDFISLLRRYYFVGGMPEAVQCHCDGKGFEDVRRIQRHIIDAYTLDFAKHAPTHDVPKLSLIWESIPGHLARENKKFIFSAIQPSARARDYENAIVWLEKTGLIHRSFAVEMVRPPLKGQADPKCFKVYALDVGLLGALAETPTEIVAKTEALFAGYAGAFAENYVAQQLAAQGGPPLYYWRSRGGKAEVDFLCEVGGAVYPLEVKAGLNPKSKSLKSFDDQFHPPLLGRSTLLNLKLDGRILNAPLYAVAETPRLLRLAKT
ncbi:MAG: ATP-binding protein [Verrucomicrobia bacterium]|nr:ATP-binding protein [Verrucomicrobiota bacterium]